MKVEPPKSCLPYLSLPTISSYRLKTSVDHKKSALIGGFYSKTVVFGRPPVHEAVIAPTGRYSHYVSGYDPVF